MDGNKVTNFTRHSLFLLFGVVLFVCASIQARPNRARSQEQIRMELLSLQNEPLEQAAVGHPFIIKVTLFDEGKRLSEPKIMGVNARRTGLHIQTVNGISTTSYTYRALINEPGEYTIGPAVATFQSDSYESNTAQLLVSDHEKIGLKQAKKQNQDQRVMFVELSVDTDELVVKESFLVSLRCYFKDGVTINAINKPEMPWLLMGNAQGPIQGIEHVGGISYHYFEWQWHAYPQEAGTFMIPAFGVQAEVDLRSRNTGMFAHMPLLFAGFMTEQVQAYSNGVTITVDPLPKNAGRLDGVGLFDSFSMSVNASEVKEGDGILLTVELEGTDGVEPVEYTVLHGIPDELRYYYSKTVMVNEDISPTKKRRWEFVLQALKEGDVEIPAQTFRYFDTYLRRYVELKSNSVLLKIVANPGLKNSVGSTHGQAFPEETNAEFRQNQPVDLLYDSWRPLPVRDPISWWIMVFICGVPLLCLLYPSFKKRCACHRLLNSPWLKRKRAFYKARISLRAAMKKKNGAAVYYVFDSLFKEIWAHSEKQDMVIEGMFKNDTMYQEWRQFVDRALAYAFDKKQDVSSDDLFFKQALNWVDIFSKEKKS